MYKIRFIIDGKDSWDNFWALREISLEVEKGETVGIIGENGAGKSTILKLIAGMLRPDRGEIKVLGKVSGLLELGAGFQLELTGRDNVFLSASLFGLTQKQAEEKYEEIINFASIGKFINAPVKCYSQGMFVRLAFAIAIHMDPDILLIDDTLAVGDEYFQRKCIQKIFELKEEGKTIIFVTHNIGMLSRICKRAIFIREGRIIKDDAVDKVIPLYTQAIGPKEGVGTLERKHLSLVFNNGRLLINWKDKLITPNSGAHTILLNANKWYSSLQADWEVKKEAENKLIAIGRFYQLALTQTWTLELTDPYEIKWDIEIDALQPFEIQEGFTNIMLNDEYGEWFTALEKGEFPNIGCKDKNWHTLFANNIRNFIGVKENKALNSQVPSLIFEQSNYSLPTQAQILNTDYLNNCRVLQYRTPSLNNYSTTQANRFAYFSGKIILDISDVDNYIKNHEEAFILADDKLRLTFDQGRCVLSWGGINLTKASHIYTSIYANERWYFSNLAHWEIKKEKKNKLIAKGTWFNLPLLQIWSIEIIDESTLLWEVIMQVNAEINIEQQHFWVMCSQDYKNWFSNYGANKFPDEFAETEIDILQKCIPQGAVGLQSQDSQLPIISLKFSKELNNFAKIFNSDFYYKARVLRIDRIEPEKDVKFSIGQYPCFKITLNLDQGKQVYIEDSNSIQEGGIKFIFINGCGRIYWKEIELTKKLSLYTSLRSQGRWYDSLSSAIWKIEERNKNIIKVIGRWLRLPIIQYWEIRLKEEKLIEFNVKMKVEEEIEIDRLQTNLMLSEIYSQWIANKEESLFPPFKENVDDDWDCVRLGQKDTEYIGVAKIQTPKVCLPAVKFYPQTLNSKWLLNIINSDIYHRGRVLQHLNSTKKLFSAGEYIYFRGTIAIED